MGKSYVYDLDPEACEAIGVDPHGPTAICFNCGRPKALRRCLSLTGLSSLKA